MINKEEFLQLNDSAKCRVILKILLGEESFSED